MSSLNDTLSYPINSSSTNDSETLNTGEITFDILIKILVAIGCLLVILLSIFGNLLVASVIIRYKRLQNATNYILLSLAIADLTVSFLVMIPSMITDVKGKWVFNDLFCKIYNAFDITCCTASILHLLLVAIDRYIAIFKPLKYKNLVRKWHVFLMVLFVWTLSLCMSFIPIFMGWNQQPGPAKADQDGENCMIEASVLYGIISSTLSFWSPLIIMTIVYIRIFIVARRQANAIAEIEMRTRSYYLAGIQQQQLYESQLREQQQQNLLNTSNEDETIEKTQDNLLGPGRIDRDNPSSIDIKESFSQSNYGNGDVNSTVTGSLNDTNAVDMKKASIESKRKTNRFLKMIRSLKSIEKRKTKDTKAIKTLGIIMGIFIACWLPFFIMYLVEACAQREIFPMLANRLITWVGYTNSFINPIVYALTNRDFRKAYTSTLRACAQFLCPRALYKKLINRSKNQNQNAYSVKHTSSAAGISEFNTMAYSNIANDGTIRNGNLVNNNRNAIRSSNQKSRCLPCNLELVSKIFCCSCCYINDKAVQAKQQQTTCLSQNGNHKPTENGFITQTSSSKNDKSSVSFSLRKLLIFNHKKPSSKEVTLNGSPEETTKFLKELDDRFNRFDKHGNLISCRI